MGKVLSAAFFSSLDVPVAMVALWFHGRRP
jgi:hypothetical protein